MTFVGIFGIIISLAGWFFAFSHASRGRVAVFALAYVLHLAAAVFYYQFAQNNISDAAGYYYDPYGFYERRGLGLSTLLVTYIAQTIKLTLDATFLDLFLLFQTFGFFGICILMRTFEEIYEELGIEQPLYVYLFLFLPGLHFWTSAIGKDAPLFLAVCLGVWAAMRIRRRYVVMGLSLLLMLLFRPHIAVIGAAALGLTVIFDRTTRIGARLLLVAGSVLAVAYSATAVKSSMFIDLGNADSVSQFLTNHESATQLRDVAGNTAVQGGFLFKLISLLFRPFFVDATTPMALVASLENVVFVVVVAGLVFRSRQLFGVISKVPYVRFAAAFAVGTILVLTVLNYNVGLGLRQKTMFVPALLVIFVTLAALRRARAAAAPARVPHQLAPLS